MAELTTASRVNWTTFRASGQTLSGSRPSPHRSVVEKVRYRKGPLMFLHASSGRTHTDPDITQTPNGYHGYWQMDINQINPHFGTESDLESLVKECHNRGMWVMLDV